MGHIKVGVKVQVRVRLGLELYRFMVVELVLLFSLGGDAFKTGHIFNYKCYSIKCYYPHLIQVL